MSIFALPQNDEYSRRSRVFHDTLLYMHIRNQVSTTNSLRFILFTFFCLGL